MITFRIHTIADTNCRVPLRRRSRRGCTGIRCAILIILSFVATARRGCTGIRCAILIILSFVATATAFAMPHHRKHVRGHKGAARSTAAQAAMNKPDEKVPIHYTHLDLPEGPGLIADIGEFTYDLNEIGQNFLKREFFEFFASHVVGLDDASGSGSGTTLDVTMKPQEENHREGDFIFGKVKGQIIVFVEKRRVIIACLFKTAQNPMQQIAAVKTLVERLTGG